MNRIVTAALLLFVCTSSAFGQESSPTTTGLPPTPDGKTWKMVWNDEFDGKMLDGSKWVARPEGKRKGGWWSPKAISLDDQGHLVISTSRTATSSWTAASPRKVSSSTPSATTWPGFNSRSSLGIGRLSGLLVPASTKSARMAGMARRSRFLTRFHLACSGNDNGHTQMGILRALWTWLCSLHWQSPATSGETDEGLWCVVANVKREHPYGPGGKETRIGTRQFRGGSKVYIAGCYPGMCDSVVAIGLHRKSRRFITCVVHVKLVENFRVKLVYQPKVIEMIKQDTRCWFRTKEDVEKWAAAFPEWQKL